MALILLVVRSLRRSHACSRQRAHFDLGSVASSDPNPTLDSHSCLLRLCTDAWTLAICLKLNRSSLLPKLVNHFFPHFKSTIRSPLTWFICFSMLTGLVSRSQLEGSCYYLGSAPHISSYQSHGCKHGYHVMIFFLLMLQTN